MKEDARLELFPKSKSLCSGDGLCQGRGAACPVSMSQLCRRHREFPCQSCQQHQQDEIHLDIKATPADYPKGASLPRINRIRDYQSMYYCETTVCDLIL